MLVIVTGLPGSGKTTVSRPLSERLALPLVAKDHYKELLFDSLGTGDRAWSKRIGQAAIALQYDAIRTIRAAVVDSALWTGVSETELEAIGLPLVQLYCDCPFEIARSRYFNRVAERHPGYNEHEATHEDYESYRPLEEPLWLSWPCVRVDTSIPVDLEAAVDALVSAWSVALTARV